MEKTLNYGIFVYESKQRIFKYALNELKIKLEEHARRNVFVIELPDIEEEGSYEKAYKKLITDIQTALKNSLYDRKKKLSVLEMWRQEKNLPKPSPAPKRVPPKPIKPNTCSIAKLQIEQLTPKALTSVVHKSNYGISNMEVSDHPLECIETYIVLICLTELIIPFQIYLDLLKQNYKIRGIIHLIAEKDDLHNDEDLQERMALLKASPLTKSTFLIAQHTKWTSKYLSKKYGKHIINECMWYLYDLELKRDDHINYIDHIYEIDVEEKKFENKTFEHIKSIEIPEINISDELIVIIYLNALINIVSFGRNIDEMCDLGGGDGINQYEYYCVQDNGTGEAYLLINEADDLLQSIILGDTKLTANFKALVAFANAVSFHKNPAYHKNNIYKTTYCPLVCEDVQTFGKEFCDDVLFQKIQKISSEYDSLIYIKSDQDDTMFSCMGEMALHLTETKTNGVILNKVCYRDFCDHVEPKSLDYGPAKPPIAAECDSEKQQPPYNFIRSKSYKQLEIDNAQYDIGSVELSLQSMTKSKKKNGKLKSTDSVRKSQGSSVAKSNRSEHKSGRSGRKSNSKTQKNSKIIDPCSIFTAPSELDIDDMIAGYNLEDVRQEVKCTELCFNYDKNKRIKCIFDNWIYNFKCRQINVHLYNFDFCFHFNLATPRINYVRVFTDNYLNFIISNYENDDQYIEIYQTSMNNILFEFTYDLKDGSRTIQQSPITYDENEFESHRVFKKDGTIVIYLKNNTMTIYRTNGIIYTAKQPSSKQHYRPSTSGAGNKNSKTYKYSFIHEKYSFEINYLYTLYKIVDCSKFRITTTDGISLTIENNEITTVLHPYMVTEWMDYASGKLYVNREDSLKMIYHENVLDCWFPDGTYIRTKIFSDTIIEGDKDDSEKSIVYLTTYSEYFQQHKNYANVRFYHDNKVIINSYKNIDIKFETNGIVIDFAKMISLTYYPNECFISNICPCNVPEVSKFEIQIKNDKKEILFFQENRHIFQVFSNQTWKAYGGANVAPETVAFIKSKVIMFSEDKGYERYTKADMKKLMCKYKDEILSWTDSNNAFKIVLLPLQKYRELLRVPPAVPEHFLNFEKYYFDFKIPSQCRCLRGQLYSYALFYNVDVTFTKSLRLMLDTKNTGKLLRSVFQKLMDEVRRKAAEQAEKQRLKYHLKRLETLMHLKKFYFLKNVCFKRIFPKYFSIPVINECDPYFHRNQGPEIIEEYLINAVCNE